MDKYKLLKTVFGHSEFRDGQEAVIDRILSGGDVLSIMPTGAGKSICYQLPALMSGGITLVISPLISLMKDQAAALTQYGVSAAFLNSSLSAAEFAQTLSMAQDGVYKLLYVAPERLETEAFVSFAKTADIYMVTVDEAHCVSQWGQDFRPSYLRISEFVEKLPKRPVVSAFTATATETVRRDIIKQLKLCKPLEITMGFDRPNLLFEVQNMTKAQKKTALLETLRRYNGKSGIVYCSTRKTTDAVYNDLCAEGFPAAVYHAGLSDGDRRRNQDDFIYDRKTVMVATNAFGMGIDKSNVSFVIHYNMPKSIEAYYQEAGRAGRDGEPAECVMLYSSSDIIINNFFIDNMLGENLTPAELELAKNRDRERLKRMTGYCNTTECLRRYLLGYFGEKPQKKCANCSNCLGQSETEDITLSAQKIISCVFRLKQRGQSLGSAMIVAVLKGGDDAKITASGYDTLSTYGIMSDEKTAAIRRIIDFLVTDNYLERSPDEYRLLSVTEKGDAMIRERQSIYMKKAAVRSKAPAAKSKPARQEETGLYGRLKTLRAKLADEQHVPAYIIFSNAALADMAEKMPLSENSFLEVSGVGEAKTKRYGKAFIEAIKKYREETQ